MVLLIASKLGRLLPNSMRQVHSSVCQ